MAISDDYADNTVKLKFAKGVDNNYFHQRKKINMSGDRCKSSWWGQSFYNIYEVTTMYTLNILQFYFLILTQ